MEQLTIELAITEVLNAKEKLEEQQLLTKPYVISSPALDELKKTLKEIKGQVADEQKRLSDELLEDEFYKEHKEKEMQLKQKLREARAKLRATIKETPDSELKKEYTINGEPVAVFKAFETKVYLNGVEQK